MNHEDREDFEVLEPTAFRRLRALRALRGKPKVTKGVMNNNNLVRLNDWLRERKLDGALLSSPYTLTWLTGYAAPIETGPDPFLGGSALAWVQGERLTAIASDAEAPALRALGVTVQEYAGYTVQEPLACTSRMAQVLQAVLAKDMNHLRGSVALEQQALSVALMSVAQAALPHAHWLPADNDLIAQRAVKTEDELSKIRAALAVCDAAQAHVRQVLRAGMTELDVWASMRAQVESIVGTRIPMLADLVSGPRTAEIGGLPTPRVMQAGDAILFDFVPRLEGYWGDCCATLFVGEPSEALKRMRHVSHAALRHGISMLRPGVRACDVDAALRKHIQDAGYEPYPHHTGHGVGVAYHEEPRIVPYETMVLKAGMVIALEPGVYVPGVGGARMEDVMLITPDGCEVLTQHLGDE